MLSTRKNSSDTIRHLVKFNKETHEVGPSSYMIEDFHLRKVLGSELNRNEKIQLINSTEVIEDQTNSFETKIMLSDKSLISTEIFIISDGRESRFAKRLNKTFFKNEVYPSEYKIFIWDKLFTPLTIILDRLLNYKSGKNVLCVIKKK